MEMYENLVKKAIEAQKNSYSPFSNFKVGSALLCENGEIFVGTNIEESSFRAGCCAERSALYSAISNGQKNFKAIAVVGGDLTQYVYPCGVCRQALNEFAPNLEIVLGTKNKDEINYKVVKLDEIFPNSFSLKK